jgi:hypothetical protein
MIGAIAVSRGARTQADVAALLGTEPVFDLVGSWEHIVSTNDGWDRVWLFGPPRRWWLRRRAIRALLDAAAVAR